MAAHGWGTDRRIVQSLFEEAHRFGFFQAVRLMEALFPERIPMAEGSEPDKEPVRLASWVSHAFPASEVQDIDPGADGRAPARMLVNIMGLAGVTGPLPAVYTDLILERSVRKDTALRDFLDIFNHRLLSLFYRLRKIHRIGLARQSPERATFCRYFYSLIGLGTPGLPDRMSVPDRSLLFYTGLIAQHPHSMCALTTLLSDYFQVPVAGRQMVGRWFPIAADQWTRIGDLYGANHRLGRNATLGRRFWDTGGGFELVLGPLAGDDFFQFLPCGDAYGALEELVRYYVGPEFEWDLRLRVRAAAVPAARLARHGAADGCRLGWSSWLNFRPGRRIDGELRIRPSLLDRLAANYGIDYRQRPGEVTP